MPDGTSRPAARLCHVRGSPPGWVPQGRPFTYEHPGPYWRRLRWTTLYDHPEEDGWSPSSLWPRDRSWVVCTDYDPWATKLAGPAALTEALLNDVDMEAVRLPWAT
ncbi:hypothetical protein GCM10017750_64920 [Streptomyces racemochromogenes]